MADKKHREGFNFYLSYFDVYKELSDRDKVLFMDALLYRQFHGVEPDNLKGMSKFAYISQKYSIDKQVKGWEDKTKLKLHPTEGGAGRVELPPTEQVQEEGEVQEEEQSNIPTAKAIDFDNLLAYINKTFGRQFKIINDAVKTKYKARVKEGYTSDNIREAINNCKKDPYHIETNYKYCTPEFFSRSVKLDLHSSIGTPEKSSDPLVDYVNQHIEQYGNS